MLFCVCNPLKDIYFATQPLFGKVFMFGWVKAENSQDISTLNKEVKKLFHGKDIQ